jgi:outer membrane biosynthesis protein TonB
MFVPIPVRIIVGTAGRVKHVHVIHASAEQRRSIEEALRQWTFKPYQLNGRTVEIETGLVFRFTPNT